MSPTEFPAGIDTLPNAAADRQPMMNKDTQETEAVEVSFQVIRVEKVEAGRLYALATVVVTVNEMEMAIQGVRVMRQPTGMLAVEAPRFRRPGGEWVPAVMLPPELKQAIADEILDQVEQIG